MGTNFNILTCMVEKKGELYLNIQCSNDADIERKFVFPVVHSF